MMLLLPTLAVAFAAFCVGLLVRIVNRRERWAKWTLSATIVLLPLLYLLSFGPACWWFAEGVEVDDGYVYHRANIIYGPIGWAYLRLPSETSRIGGMIEWYATRRNDRVLIWIDDGDSSVVVGGHH